MWGGLSTWKCPRTIFMHWFSFLHVCLSVSASALCAVACLPACFHLWSLVGVLDCSCALPHLPFYMGSRGCTQVTRLVQPVFLPARPSPWPLYHSFDRIGITVVWKRLCLFKTCGSASQRSQMILKLRECV